MTASARKYETGQLSLSFTARRSGGSREQLAAARAARRYTRTPNEIRFWRFVEKGPGCWTWTGAKGQEGYGKFSVLIPRLHQIRAHRFSYELHFGPLPAGMQVCHHCDTPSCVRPDHLFVGTQLDNMRDMVAKGRSRNNNSSRTHCKNGHEFTPGNTRIETTGSRRCVQCQNAYKREWRARHTVWVRPEVNP